MAEFVTGPNRQRYILFSEEKYSTSLGRRVDDDEDAVDRFIVGVVEVARSSRSITISLRVQMIRRPFWLRDERVQR